MAFTAGQLMNAFTGGGLPAQRAPQPQPQPQPQQTPLQQGAQQVQNGGQPVQPTPNPIAAIAGTAGVGTAQQQGAGGQAPAAGSVQPQSNPLDSYEALFKMQDNGNTPQHTALDAPLFTSDRAGMDKLLGEANFAQVDTQLMQRALSGDQQAFMDVLNGVARNVMRQSVTLNQQLIEGGVKAYNTRLSEHLPARFKEFASKEALASNPRTQHGAVSPMMAATVQHVLSTNPQLTVAQAMQQAEGYLAALGQHLAPQQTASPPDPMTGVQAQQRKGNNWAEEFGL